MSPPSQQQVDQEIPPPPPRSSTHSSLLLRNAVTLSNIACSLLEKHAYRQAHDTLKEAVGLLRQSSAPHSQHHPSHHDLPQADDQQWLHRAHQRLSKPEVCRFKCTITVLSTDSDQSLATALQHCQTSLDAIFPLRIEALLDDDLDVNLLCMTLIYNFGLTYVAETLTRKRSLVRKLRTGAVRILNLAERLLLSGVVVSQDYSPSTILVGYLLLSTMGQVLYDMGRVEEALVSLVAAASFKEQGIEHLVWWTPASAVAPAA